VMPDNKESQDRSIEELSTSFRNPEVAQETLLNIHKKMCGYMSEEMDQWSVLEWEIDEILTRIYLYVRPDGVPCPICDQEGT
jgi:hypothetical protein